MNESRQNVRVGKPHQSSKVGGKALNAKDLTCHEAQIEELLSKGESTEGDADEEQDERR
ncbi:MAG: hypothetical protein P0120_24300 [Nitrospira sp.]|nr:hypothetical protein [Nitrospira sp.]